MRTTLRLSNTNHQVDVSMFSSVKFAGNKIRRYKHQIATRPLFHLLNYAFSHCMRHDYRRYRNHRPNYRMNRDVQIFAYFSPAITSEVFFFERRDLTLSHSNIFKVLCFTTNYYIRYFCYCL